MNSKQNKKKSPPSRFNPKCEAFGCEQTGEYKAPKSRHKTQDYQWLCVEHVREHNQNWDYFKGMSPAEIEEFVANGVNEHRPTWARETHIFQGRSGATYNAMLTEELKKFFHQETGKPKRPKSQFKTKEEKALDILEMEEESTLAALKTKYRALVKKYHPDLHKGDKACEEKFKEITVAYSYLLNLHKD